ncbi:hypothetical protein P6144_13505 [Sphingomonas sp. HITSZ_GF]|uniref:hypothetical protein n=1 Tax=Sphingomonas sp. HITSZ_GF TaxID=3037247 RepID=UPI00240E106A|nr:hypothetical protein [Sphingomonas sp. HITSZ_GF]MDG2534673.1 hypothetical protein [Sphingomonas sp. HITSZ_GF]
MILAPLALLVVQQEDPELERLIRLTYALYVGADAMPRPAIPLTPRLAATEAECARLRKRIGRPAAHKCGGNRDVLCQCTNPYDFAWTKIGVTVRYLDPTTAQAVIDIPPPRTEVPDGKPDVAWLFVRNDGQWAIADFGEYGRVPASYRDRLVSDIQAMRGQLKLPTWRYAGP